MRALPLLTRHLGVAVGLVVMAACSAVGSVAERERSPARVPDLEEIFLEPSIAGLAPSPDATSPDGRWLLVRWAHGAAEVSDQVLRLLDLERPEDSGRRGTPLTELVRPHDGEDGPLQRVEWLPEGARLIARRGRQVVLYDAPTGRTVPLVVEAPPFDPSADPDAEDPHRRYAGGIRRLDVLQDGAFLEVLDDEEAYRAPLGTALPERPHLLDDLEHVSADLDAAPLRLALNKDSSIVFGSKVAPIESPEDEDELDGATDGERPTPQIYHRADQRSVVLADFDPDRLSSIRMSPDGRFVFALELDRSASPAATLVPDYLTERVTTRKGRRLLAEDGPEPLRAWIWNTSNGQRSSFFDDPAPRAVWSSSLGWAPQEHWRARRATS